MPAIPHPPRSRAGVAVFAAVVLGVLLAPAAAAFADEETDRTDDTLVELPEVAVEDEDDATDEDEDPDADDPADEDEDLDAAVSSTCDDHLATATPAGIDGDEAAVAITAQAVDTEVDGWINVAWEAAAGTTLRAVLATDLDGAVTTLPGGSTGSAADVTSLVFCGTSEPEDTEDADGDGDGDASGQDDTDDTDDVTEVIEVEEAPESTETATEPSEADADDADAAATEEEDVPGVVVVEPPDAPPADDEPEPTEPEDEAEEDAEVLGVQLTRDPEAEDAGGLRVWMAALVVLALLTAAGGLVWSRRS